MRVVLIAPFLSEKKQHVTQHLRNLLPTHTLTHAFQHLTTTQAIMKSTSRTSRPASATNPVLRGHLHEITRRTTLKISTQNAAVSPTSEAPQRISPDIAGIQTSHKVPTPSQSKAMALNLTDLRDTLLHIQSMGQTWLQKIMAQERIIKQQDRELTESHERVQRAGGSSVVCLTQNSMDMIKNNLL